SLPPATPQLYTLSLHDALPIFISPKLSDELKVLAASAKILHRGRRFKASDVEGGIWLVLNTVRTDGVLSRALYELAKQKGFLLRSEEHTSELQSRFDLVCRLLL